MDFRLRDVRPQDFETLWRIDQQCFAPGISYSRVELVAYLRRPGAFGIVAESLAAKRLAASKTASTEKGSTEKAPADKSRTPSLHPIVGFIVAEARSRGAGHIITIDVLPEARKARVGSGLLLSAEERILRAGCTCVILETAVDNRAALAFYRTHEYRALRTIPGYYSDGVDALVLKKDLLSPSGPAKLPQ